MKTLRLFILFVLYGLAVKTTVATQWSIETSTNLNTWQAGPTNDTPQIFARLQLINAPSNTTLSIGSITINSNATSMVMSSGVVVVNVAPPPSNLWNAIQSLLPTNPIAVIIPSPQ